MICPDGSWVTWSDGEQAEQPEPEPEPEQTEPMTFHGDVLVRTPIELEAAKQYTSIEGSLRILIDGEMEFPNLTTVTGGVAIQLVGPQQFILEVSMPVLTSIGGDLLMAGNMEEFNFPVLATVGGNLTFTNAAMQDLDFPRLTWVSGDLTIMRCHLLRAIPMPALADVRQLIFHSNSLHRCELDALADQVEDRGGMDLPVILEFEVWDRACVCGEVC